MGRTSMSQDGAKSDDEKSRVQQITDENGVTYKIGKFLGRGMEGRTFEGEVVPPLPDKMPYGLKQGTKVAIKQQLVKDEEALELEFDILAKEGSLYGSKKVTVDDNEFMYVAIPILTGKSLREQMYDVDPDPNARVAVRGKIDLTTDEKKNISYSLLKDYHAQHLLSILHVDIKPDNVMYDKKTGKVKVIDFGNSYDLDLFSEHPKGFQSPGALYAAPENYNKGSQGVCSIKADEHALGMMIASLWTSTSYEQQAKEVGKNYNMALNARETLDDILAPDAIKPKEMPQDLWDIVRHLTAINPNDRPENLAQAHGMSDSVELKGLVEAQLHVDNYRANILKTIGSSLRALGNDKEKEKYDRIKNLSPTDALADPTAKYKKLSAEVEKLKVINAKLLEIDGRNPPKTPEAQIKRTNQRKEAVTEYNKALEELAKSTDPDYQKLFGVASKMSLDPVEKMKQISKESKKLLPKVLATAAKEGSLYVAVENQVNQIMNSSREASTMRVGLMELYGDLIVLATKDPTYAEQCRGITAQLSNMVEKLDTVRFNEARILQGQAVRKENVELEPKVLAEQYQQPPMTLPERRRGMWSQIKQAFRELFSGPKVTVQPTQVSQPKVLEPVSLSKLDTLLKTPEVASSSAKKDHSEVAEIDPVQSVSKTYNPLDLGYLRSQHQHGFLPQPTSKPLNDTPNNFVNDCLTHIHDMLEKLIHEYNNVKVEDSMESHDKIRNQKQKDFLFVEIEALVKLSGYLIKHPEITLDNKTSADTLAKTVDSQLTVVIDAAKKLNVESGLGSYTSLNSRLTVETQTLLRDILQDLKKPELSHGKEQHLHH